MHANILFRVVAALGTMLLLGCATPGKDADAPPVPSELQHATASYEQTLAWAARVLGASDAKQLKADHFELFAGGPRALFLSNPSAPGNGNPTHLIFQRYSRGLSYTGKLAFAAYRAAPVDADQRPRVVTFWRLTSDQGELRLYTLGDQGFELTSQVPLRPQQDQDAQLYDQIFNGLTLSQVLVAKTFPVSTLSKP